jgi:hypothetical protein
VRYRRPFLQRRTIVAALGAAAVVLIATWLLIAPDRASRKVGVEVPRRFDGVPVASGPPAPGRLHPPPVSPPTSPRQSLIDSELRQAEQPSTLRAGGVASLPGPGYSPEYPPIPVADRSDAITYGVAFVTELLDRGYAHQSRHELLAWAQAESAPNRLPGVPADLAGRALLLSLLYPASAAGPVPSPAEWSQDAVSSRIETVEDVQAGFNPEWLSLTASGWQPTDPAMTILTVTGTRVGQASAGISTESFSLDLTLGSNRSRIGYGAVAVDDWTVM